MGRLISDATFAKIRKALNDTQDTFYGKVVTYKRDRNSATRFQRDVETARKYEDIDINGLVVWSSSDEDAEIMRKLIGAFDPNTAYCNVKFDDALELGLVLPDKNLQYKPAEDKLVVDGVIYPVLGIVKLGQLWDTNVVVRILFRKDVDRK